MPADGMDWHPRDELLTFEELTRIATVCVERFGFDSIRLTGGEPTVRANVVDVVRQIAETPGIQSLSIANQAPKSLLSLFRG